jgi:hypothetical protein
MIFLELYILSAQIAAYLSNISKVYPALEVIISTLIISGHSSSRGNSYKI